MDLAARIAQFENMAQADPTNEMAHFSLGRAYTEAGRHADAAASYLKAVGLNNAMSKAYQLAGEALVNAGDRPRAEAVLTQGYIIAAQRGDLMPKTAIATLLKTIGAPVPDVAEGKPATTASGPASAAASGGGGGGFVCRQSGKPGTKMARPPFKGPVGAWIHANISKETFDLWIRQGTKVINELRLDLSREKDNEAYDQHMREFLGIDDALLAQLTAGRPA